MKSFRKRLPAGFRRGAMDELVCPHRDLSVCRDCANGVHSHQIAECFGVHYWLADADEAAAHAQMLKEFNS